MLKRLSKGFSGPASTLMGFIFKEWHNSLKDQKGKTSAPRVTAFFMTLLIIVFVIVFYATGKVIPDNYLSAVENVLMVTLGYAKSESWSWPGKKAEANPPVEEGDGDPSVVQPPEKPFTAPTDGARK
jgi:hypothetical protein